MQTTALFKQAIPAILLLSGLISISVSALEQPKVYDLKPNERVLILGDSTTYDGCTVGGYVRLVDQAIQEQIPERKAAVRGSGGPGAMLAPERPAEKRIPFAETWKSFLGQPNTPTTVIINLGLNDSKGGEGNVPNYEKWVRQYVVEFREIKMNVVLCTPTLWGGLK